MFFFARHALSRKEADLRRFARPRRRASEAGFAMIEVLASITLLAIVSVGVYTGIDGAGEISGLNKARTVAASLAQEDLDRMRGFRISDLSTLDQSITKTPPGGITYTVASKGEWVDDSTSGSGDGCASGGSTLHYLKAVSTVTWPKMGAVQPVRVETLVPATAAGYGGQGNSGLTIRTQAGDPLTAQSVTATGPGGTTRTGTTSSTGCTFFGFLDAGNYTFSFSRPGYVDPSGANSVSKTVPVNAGGTLGQGFLYDQAGQVRATFETVRMGLAAGTTVTSAATAHHLSAEKHANAPSGASVPPGTWSNTPLAASSSITTPKVFYPFATPYRVNAGNCTFQTPPTGTSLGSVTVTPNASPANVTIRVPAINIRVTDSSNATVTTGTSTRVSVPVGSTCTGGAVMYPLQTTVTTAQSSGLNAPVGSMPNPGHPWGTYDVCAQLSYSGTVWKNTVTVANTNPAGTAQTVVKVNNAASGRNIKGTC